MTPSQAIASDIRALERHLRDLRRMQGDLQPGLTIMGPGRAGRNALAVYDAQHHLAAAVEAYHLAIGDLGQQADLAEITEQVAAMRGHTGARRAEIRRYARDLIESVKAGAAPARVVQIGGGRDRRVG